MENDLKASDLSQAQRWQSEFHMACREGRWPEAEEARLRAVTHYEAGLDAYMRVARAVGGH